jgi:hypothetical protein
MKLYCLALALIAVSIAFGQPQGLNISSTACTNNSSSMISIQPQERPEPSASMEISSQAAILANISITCEVVEVNNNTNARFGVGKKEPAKQEMYKLTINNTGEVPISNVIVSAVMAEGMRFESTRYYEENRGRLDVMRDPIEFKKGAKTNLTWDIGIMGPEEIKSILLEAYLKPQVNNTQVSVMVRGNTQDGTKVRSSQDGAELRKCNRECPDWSMPQ